MINLLIRPAPIVLFVYNRPWHTQQTVEALQKNELAKESELYIYSDAAKNEFVIEKVAEVREYIKSIKGFQKITIIEREKNLGLANSIIDGVTDIVNKYGKVIVLEDDLITNPYFLKFMNEALEFYKDEKQVWHINGWNNPIKIANIPDIYFSKISYSWGWATWNDRWSQFEKNPNKLVSKFSKKRIYEFNIDGYYDFWKQVVQNKEGGLDTWAVFWYATIFIHEGLCLNNNLKLVKNIGTDGSGVNCGIDDVYKNQILAHRGGPFIFKTDIQEDKLANKRLKEFISKTQKSFVSRFKKKFKKVIGFK